jgi:hypothetical protein
MNRLIQRKIVEIPENDPVIAYKKLTKDMRSPYRHHTYEIGKTYHSHCFTGDYRIEGFFSMHKSCTDAWAGDIVFEVAIWGNVLFINNDNIESEYLKILKKVRIDVSTNEVFCREDTS